MVNNVLKTALAKELTRTKEKPGKFKTISGFEGLEKVIDIDQSPIGRTPRSNPATYTSVFDDMRDLFASTNEAKIRGYKKGRFSFNVKGGRCDVPVDQRFVDDRFLTSFGSNISALIKT